MSQTHSFLFEIGVEELPAQALLQMSKTLEEAIQSLLNEAQLNFQELTSFATPRRLIILVKTLDGQQKDDTILVRGPSIKAAFDADGNPQGPARGFAASCGVAVDELTRMTTKKGEHLAFNQFKKGQLTSDLIPGFVGECLKKLAAAKGMRWSDTTYKFLRPIRWLTVLLDTDVISCSGFGVESGRVTYGHRIHHPDPIELTHAEEYEPRLQSKGYVIPRFAVRRQTILDQVHSIAASQKLSASPSSELVDEITGLVEWPVTLCGTFSEEFLQVPNECLISTMEQNQKYIAMHDPDGRLANAFLFVANLESQNPALVIQGNERVIRPRFADAQFFFEQDQKQNLLELRDGLKRVIYQKELGSIFDKTERLAITASQFSEKLQMGSDEAKLAGQLSKVDLLTSMVGEFPELQGIMGRYYAYAQGFSQAVAQALEEQYLPRGQGDGLPNSNLGIILSLADKLDALVGMFAVGQEPKADKDPFALRRMALGIVRMCIELELDLDVLELAQLSKASYTGLTIADDVPEKVALFIMQRLPTLYKDSGIDMRLVRSVEALKIFNPSDFNKRLVVLKNFYQGDAAAALAEVHKRVNNILKKNPAEQGHVIVEAKLVEPAEQALHRGLLEIDASAKDAIEKQDYETLLQLGVSLREVIDLFFVEVKVMSDDEIEKKNRLALLMMLRHLFAQVGDLSFLA